jgi:hypothetical protein
MKHAVRCGNKNAVAAATKAASPLALIFSAQYRRRTIVNAALLTVAIIGLWAGAVYEPTAWLFPSG